MAYKSTTKSMDAQAALRIQSNSDRTHTNQDFKEHRGKGLGEPSLFFSYSVSNHGR